MTAGGRPAEPEVIWARPQRTGRGPRPAHSRETIAAEAVRIADAEGIEAVSMRRVAAGIGAAGRCRSTTTCRARRTCTS